MIDRQHPLIPKDPSGKAKVIVLGRLSKPKETESETQATIESSMQVAKDYLARSFSGPVDIRCLGEQISGMVAERETILTCYDLVEKGGIDLVLCEELRCVYRNPRLQYAFVQDMYDMQTRFISIVDNIDTADENWETMLSVATVRHGLAVPDASRRVRRQAKTSFHGGGMVHSVKFGYRKLSKDEAAAGASGPKGLRMARVSEATPTLMEIRRQLMDGIAPARVVEWLERKRIAPALMVTTGKWSVATLKNLMTDPILHGYRVFKRTVYTRLFSTGFYRRDPNPKPEICHVPELAHMTKAEQESMLVAVGWQLQFGKVQHADHPRRRISRKKTLWPGQAARCSACGGMMVIAGDCLRCPRSFKVNGKTCWNRAEAPILLARELVRDWIIAHFDLYPAARQAFLDAAWTVAQEIQGRHKGDDELRRIEIADLEKQRKNLSKAIAKGGQLESLLTMLAEVEAQLRELKQQAVQNVAESPDDAFESKESFGKRLADAIDYLMAHSFEFNDVMRQFFPEITVFPVQALDSGRVHSRAVLRFGLDASAADQPASEPVEVTFDLFVPPLHIGLLPNILRIQQEMLVAGKRPTLRNIAPEIGASYMTVKRAMKYHRLMLAEGLSEPFRVLHGAPQSASRWCDRRPRRSNDAA